MFLPPTQKNSFYQEVLKKSLRKILDARQIKSLLKIGLILFYFCAIKILKKTQVKTKITVAAQL